MIERWNDSGLALIVVGIVAAITGGLLINWYAAGIGVCLSIAGQTLRSLARNSSSKNLQTLFIVLLLLISILALCMSAS